MSAPEDRYIHWSQRMGTYVFSDKYWRDDLQTDPLPAGHNKIEFFSRDVDPGCPNELKLWFKESPTNPGEEISETITIVCKDLGHYRCPETHPFAYNNGDDCCASPFEDVNDALGNDCDGSPISLGIYKEIQFFFFLKYFFRFYDKNLIHP